MRIFWDKIGRSGAACLASHSFGGQEGERLEAVWVPLMMGRSVGKKIRAVNALQLFVRMGAAGP